MCGQSVLDKVFVDKMCVDKVWRRAEEEKAEEEPGIQNQKQEPHTKMWGTSNMRLRSTCALDRKTSLEEKARKRKESTTETKQMQKID